MPPDTATNENARHDGWQTLRRFVPYLWPRDDPALRWRIAGALLLVLGSKAIVLTLPFFYKNAIDKMTIGGTAALNLALAFVLAYAAGRFSGVVFDNLRNIVFERVGQDATRALAVDVFHRLHRLSLRFHLARRTGEVTAAVACHFGVTDSMRYACLWGASWLGFVGVSPHDPPT